MRFGGAALARGLNLNAPMGGIRPNTQFGNVIEIDSGASSRQHTLQANITANPGAMFPIRSKTASGRCWPG